MLKTITPEPAKGTFTSFAALAAAIQRADVEAAARLRAESADAPTSTDR